MKKNSRGFTLVEMMVSLAIFSLLVGTLMSGYSQGLMLWERGQADSRYWLTLQYRHELLRQVFSQALMSDYRLEHDASFPYFVADDDGLALMTRSPILDLPGHVRPVRFEFRRKENGAIDIFYQEAGRHDDVERGITWSRKRRVLLLHDVRDLSFRYLAPLFPLPSELSVAELSDEDKLRYREQAEWLSWYDGSILWKSPERMEMQFRDEQGNQLEWSFSLPEETDAWVQARDL